MTIQHRARLVSAIAISAGLLLAACSDTLAPDPVSPPAAALAKGGNSGGGGGGEDGGCGNPKGGSVIQGDLVLEQGDSPAITSSCPTPHDFSKGAGWALVFGKSGYLTVGPLTSGLTGKSDYYLTDDVILNVTIEKGKNGRITHVRLRGQDLPEEILHDTWLGEPDAGMKVPVAVPVVPTRAGFTVHVHAKNVPVWRWDSHTEINHGTRQEIVGYISIGDLVYPAQ